MTRLFSALVLSCLLTSAVSAYEPAKPVKAESDDVAELLTILTETDSTDTFLVTLDVLVGLEPDRKGVIPVVIRNADRLGLLKGYASGKVTKEQEAVADALEKLVSARGQTRGKSARPACQPPASPVPSLSTYKVPLTENPR